MQRRKYRSLWAFTLAAATVASAPASAQLIAYDGFGNGPLPDLAGSAGGTGWTSAWTSVSDNITKVSGPGLLHPGLDTSPGAAVTPAAGGSWPSSVYSRGLPTPPAGTSAIYVSFLMRDDASWGIWGGLSFGTYPYEMTVGSPLGYYTYGLMLSEGLADASHKPLVQGETTLVVVSISKNTPAAGITYRMYLDPVVGAPQPAFPDAMLSVGMMQSLPAFVSIDNGTGFTTDEVRVGLTWDSVLPPELSWIDLGGAKPGSAGWPKLSGMGSLTPASTNRLELAQAKAFAPATLVAGLTELGAPFKGGTLVPFPQFFWLLHTNGSGSASLSFLWPAGIPANTTVFFQSWIQDGGATFGLAASNGLGGVSSP